MATTVHIPRPLLAQAQRRARTLGISRNRLIVRALERELADRSSWAAGPAHRGHRRGDRRARIGILVTSECEDMSRVPDLVVESWRE